MNINTAATSDTAGISTGWGKEKSWFMISVNQRAAAIVRHMIDEREALGLGVKQLKNGAIVLDAGIAVPGSMEGGRLFASACMGGLGQVSFMHQSIESGEFGKAAGFQLPFVAVSISRPHIACMASQYAGWAIKQDKYFAIGSGPARALYAGEKIFQQLDYQDEAETGVLMLEGRDLPNEGIAAFVAEKCGVRPERLFLVIAPTASLVSSIQIAARSVETGMHKLMALGFDVRRIQAASGLCPLAPIASDDMRAIGRTNDAILYGAQVFYSVQADDRELKSLIERIPSSSSRDYGTSFYELLMRHKGDFFQIDPLLFSPAQVQINNLNSGHTFCAGHLNPSLLKASLIES
jgi:methenyltetrahydromethanopterin cyclohydrolase